MANACLRVAFLESFFGGSHRAFAEGWKRHSRHAVEVAALPARFWKWRMRGAAFEYARRLRVPIEGGGVDVLFATGLMDLAHLQALLPRRLPSVLYFHENQVSYPTRSGQDGVERDLQYAFTNLASALAADRVVFNSVFQRDAFFLDLKAILRRMPDVRPTWALAEIGQKTEVVPLGAELADIVPPPPRRPGSAPLILWNHRWEYDKAPEEFFLVLQNLARKGTAFRVAVAGESFSHAPPAFEEARRWLGDRVVQWGYLPDRAAYVRLLAECDFAVSTSLQENFGLSVVEATYAGAHPLLPRRLSYPEILPLPLHAQCLYDSREDLEARLEAFLVGKAERVPVETLRAAMAPHAWENRIGAFDELILQLFRGNRNGSVV